VGVSNVSNISERLTLVELTHWCAQNTQPRYPIGLAFGTTCKIASKPICFTSKRGLAVLEGLNILRGKATFLATTSYVQFSRSTYRDRI